MGKISALQCNKLCKALPHLCAPSPQRLHLAVCPDVPNQKKPEKKYRACFFFWVLKLRDSCLHSAPEYCTLEARVPIFVDWSEPQKAEGSEPQTRHENPDPSVECELSRLPFLESQVDKQSTRSLGKGAGDSTNKPGKQTPASLRKTCLGDGPLASGLSGSEGSCDKNGGDVHVGSE